MDDFGLYEQLWGDTFKFLQNRDVWTDSSILEIDADNMEELMGTWQGHMKQLAHHFRTQRKVLVVVQQLEKMLEEFAVHIPFVRVIRNPGMKHRHWAMISEIMHKTIEPNEGLTLSVLIRMGLEDHLPALMEIGDAATRELGLERSLEKMQGEWRSVMFEIQELPSAGSFIVQGADEIMSLLDDHIVKTQAIRRHPSGKPIEARVTAWETRLITTQDVLQEWLKCQRMWLYLEPIFASTDVQAELVKEFRLFQGVDRMWKKVMMETARKPNVLTICSNETLLKKFADANGTLDSIHKVRVFACCPSDCAACMCLTATWTRCRG